MPVKTRNTKHETHLIAWHGWSLGVPETWNPVKVDGDAAAGSLLLADLHAPRLGLRWKPAPKRGDASAWADRALRDEVGRLAAAEATDVALPRPWALARGYRDPDPPGRDVFVGHSRASNRVIQVVHHADRPGDAFFDRLLPSLHDASATDRTIWCLLGMLWVTPPGVRVRWYGLNAGDLSLGLETPGRRGLTVVRQVGPASIALARQPLDAWLAHLPASVRRLYRPVENATPDTLECTDGRVLDGRVATLARRRRLWWAWPVERQQTVVAFHDTGRDRLLLGRSPDASLLRDVLATTGTAL